ncbi:MAG: tol-pal system protein YbgF [Burkholderiales bacterium]|nr:tol-pal system protein YbgF [Burkholderiales bacterium]
MRAAPLTSRAGRWRGLALCQAVCLAALFAPLTSHAGIFDDDEARRAILEMRQQRKQDAESADARLQALSAQVEQLRRSLLDMNAQIELLRGEVAIQRGSVELLQRDASELQRKQKDAQSAFDERVRKLEPQSMTVDGKTFLADADEKRAFDDAIARLRAADFAGGATALNAFLKRYPQTGYFESAQYWLGNAHYGLRDHKEAIKAFRSLVERAPDHQRTPEAMLSIANCQSELKDNEAARRTLEQLVRQHSQTEAAQAARDRLLLLTPAKAPARKGK